MFCFFFKGLSHLNYDWREKGKQTVIKKEKHLPTLHLTKWIEFSKRYCKKIKKNSPNIWFKWDSPKSLLFHSFVIAIMIMKKESVWLCQLYAAATSIGFVFLLKTWNNSQSILLLDLSLRSFLARQRKAFISEH